MKLNLINGNGKQYTTDDITILLNTKNKLNEVFLKHVLDQTGLDFKCDNYFCYKAQPQKPLQLAKLLTLPSTYKFEICYTDNASYKATIFINIVERK
jgi:hypothetical protein